MTDYDVIVVGAGHNGLTAAVELSRAGKRVLVLEKTATPGGMAQTREIFPGYKHSVGAWALLVFREEIIKYLELDQQGFDLIRPESSYTVFGEEGSTPFIGYTDPIELANHLLEDHGIDAMRGFQDLARFLQVWKKSFEKYINRTPPTIEQMIAEAETGEEREALHALNYDSAMGILRRFFPETGKFGTILGSLTASAVDGTHKGPFSKGGACSLSYHYCAGDNYDFKLPRGGIGSLSYCLEKVVNKYGGEIRYKSPIESFIVEDGSVAGVVLKGGETISANAVISTLDAHSTFIRLMPESASLPSDFVHSIEDIDYTNGYIQIHLCLDDLPTFTGHMEFVNGTDQALIMAYIPSPEMLHEAWQQYKQGEVPDNPAVYFYFPSMYDSSLAPEGKHTCTMFSHYFPAHTPKGEHKAMKLAAENNMLNCVEKIAPGFRDLITNKAVFTQHYFEKAFGATGGDFAQGLIHPEQMFGNRAVPAYANYQTPLQNLFLAGGGCHPGPGVTCIPGINGAKVVLQALDQTAEQQSKVA